MVERTVAVRNLLLVGSGRLEYPKGVADMDSLDKHVEQISFWHRAAKFTKNKNDQWNHAGGFSMSICAGLSLKMQPRNN